MTDGAKTPPKYNSALVEQAILEVAIELHPQHLTIGELSSKIVSDSNDRKEVETVAQAIRDLKRSGLLSYRDVNEVVEPTHAALRAFALLAG
jgi:hypothetical protein